MAISDRYRDSVEITAEGKTEDDGYGGLTRAASAVVVSGYTCMTWTPRPFARQAVVKEFGLKDTAIVVNMVGAYNASIAIGQFVSLGSNDYRILAVAETHGATDTPLRTSCTLVKLDRKD